MKGFYSIFAAILASLALAVVVYGILSLSQAHAGELMQLQGRLLTESSKDSLTYLNDTLDDALFDIAWNACPCASGVYDQASALSRMNAYAVTAKSNLSLFSPYAPDVTLTGASAPATLVCDSEGDFHFYTTLIARSGNATRVLRGEDLGKKVRITLGSTLDISLFAYSGAVHRVAHIDCTGGATTTTTLGGSTTTTTLGATTTTTTTTTTTLAVSTTTTTTTSTTTTSMGGVGVGG